MIDKNKFLLIVKILIILLIITYVIKTAQSFSGQLDLIMNILNVSMASAALIYASNSRLAEVYHTEIYKIGASFILCRMLLKYQDHVLLHLNVVIWLAWWIVLLLIAGYYMRSIKKIHIINLLY